MAPFCLKILKARAALAMVGLATATPAVAASYTDTFDITDHFYSGGTVRLSVDNGSVTEDVAQERAVLELFSDAPGFDESRGTLTRVDLSIDYAVPWRVVSRIRGFENSSGGVVSTAVRLTGDLSVRARPDVRFEPTRTLIDKQPLGFMEETSVCSGTPEENCDQQNNFVFDLGSPLLFSFTDPDALFAFGGRYNYFLAITVDLIAAQSTETSRYRHFGGTVPRDGTFSLPPPSATLSTTYHFTPVPLPAGFLLLPAGLAGLPLFRRRPA